MRMRSDVSVSHELAKESAVCDMPAGAAGADLGADACEHAVAWRTTRLLQLHDNARCEFEAAEQKLASVRLTFDRVLAGDIEPEILAETIPENAVAAVNAPVGARGRFGAVLAVTGLAVVAIMAGLAVSLNAATPVQIPAVDAVQTAALVAPDERQRNGAVGIGRSEDAAQDFGARIYAARFAKAPAAERACLARAVYYEARGEEMDGQIAVAQVVLNRARSKKWPNTICGVVHQGIERGEKCQFSFACFTHLSPPFGEKWDQAQQVAEQAVNGQAWLRELIDATYYHTTAVAPVWRTALTPISTIGTHIFYRDADGVQTASFDPARYAEAAGVAGQAAEAARIKAAAATRVKAAASSAGATVRRGQGGAQSDDWKSSVFSR